MSESEISTIPAGIESAGSAAAAEVRSAWEGLDREYQLALHADPLTEYWARHVLRCAAAGPCAGCGRSVNISGDPVSRHCGGCIEFGVSAAVDDGDQLPDAAGDTQVSLPAEWLNGIEERASRPTTVDDLDTLAARVKAAKDGSQDE